MLNLAKRLVSKGVHVTLATTDVANVSTNFISNQNIKPKSPGISVEFFSDGLRLEFDRVKNSKTFGDSLSTNGSRNFSHLLKRLITEGKKFHCVIGNPFLPWVPGVVAEHDIPCAVLWIQACAVYSIYYHYFRNPKLFPKLDNLDESINLPGMPTIRVRDLPSLILPSSDISPKAVREFIHNLDKVKWVLGNSFNELEEDVVRSMVALHPIYPIGPLVSPSLLGKEETISGNVDLWSAEHSCIDWLDKRPPSSVVYISFGSILVLPQKQIDSLALGLKNSNQPFLWVIKPPDKGAERKCGELPPNFLEETKDRGLVVRWCPQEKVLTHQALACFITHCGWNSTLETIVAGVPVITYPEWSDQPTDAKLLVDVFKVGVRLETEDGVAAPEEVERCISEITSGPKAAEMKKRAVELKEAAKKAVADGGSSDQNIDQFIAELIKESSC
ncbi:hypothetical protein Tsubulata_024473 [Turnera subulata]|uniref:Glycosyltransferase n=1 Tax=Turnera subulata TaxID=218843 RepID=A0A9Q0JBE1_9ROSI|nr:hypothetical protein Tsubulata_024473 [Turnera subulata]